MYFGFVSDAVSLPFESLFTLICVILQLNIQIHTLL